MADFKLKIQQESYNPQNYIWPAGSSANGYLKDIGLSCTGEGLVLKAQHHSGNHDIPFNRVVFQMAVSADSQHVDFYIEFSNVSTGQVFSLSSSNIPMDGYQMNLSWALPLTPPSATDNMSENRLYIVCEDNQKVYGIGYGPSGDRFINVNKQPTFMTNVVLPALTNSGRAFISARLSAIIGVINQEFADQASTNEVVRSDINNIQRDLDNLTNEQRDFSSRFSTI